MCSPNCREGIKKLQIETGKNCRGAPVVAGSDTVCVSWAFLNKTSPRQTQGGPPWLPARTLLVTMNLYRPAPTARKSRRDGYQLRKAMAGLAQALLVAILAAGAALAQRPHRMPSGAGPRPPNQAPRSPGPRMQGPANPQQHQPGFLQRLRDLPPEEQERVLANDTRFQNLPPDRQKQIRENLSRWNSLTPEQKEKIRERQDILQSLSPAQREQARETFKQWRQLSPERRQNLTQAFREMRDLPPGQRQAFLSSPEIQKRFSPDERHILEGMGKLLPESARGPGDF